MVVYRSDFEEAVSLTNMLHIHLNQDENMALEVRVKEAIIKSFID